MGMPDRLLFDLEAVSAPTMGDRFGNQVADWDAATTRTFRGRIQQDNRQETYTDGRASLEDRWLLLTNDRLAGVRRVVWPAEGDTYDVHGDPEPVYDAGAYHHTEATLRRVQG